MEHLCRGIIDSWLASCIFSLCGTNASAVDLPLLGSDCTRVVQVHIYIYIYICPEFMLVDVG